MRFRGMPPAWLLACIGRGGPLHPHARPPLVEHHQWVDVHRTRGGPMRFYHNPRCSKSRQALALLEKQHVSVDVVRYLEVGVVEEDLPLLASLDGIVRKKEAGAQAMAALKTSDDVMALLKSNPRVLERPVLVVDGKAVIGRPPEDVLSLLD